MCTLAPKPPPHLRACFLWLPAVRGYSDRFSGLMELVCRAAASQHIKPQLSLPQQTRVKKNQTVDALLRTNSGLLVCTHGETLMSLWQFSILRRL